jgi:fructan beta-fructosidase
MSNWDYANQLPSMQWRNAMTIARELRLEQQVDTIRVASIPVPELVKIRSAVQSIRVKEISAGKPAQINAGADTRAWQLELEAEAGRDFHIRLMNEPGEVLIVGFDSRNNRFYTDRGLSGQVRPMVNFARKITAPRLSRSPLVKINLLIDASSIEFFADEGLTVMSVLFFPRQPFTKAVVASPEKTKISALTWWRLSP